MRSAGCVINDIADRKVDGHVERTCQRPLVTGEITLKQAVILFLILSVTSFLLVLSLDWYTIALAPVGLMLAVSYPFAKRYTHLPQLHLGIAFGWAIPMAFMAVQGEVPLLAWGLYLITAIWAVAYDTLYAMVDREDDLKIGVKSTAILFGRFDRVAVFILQIVILMGLVVIGIHENLNLIYYSAIAVAGALVIYQQWMIRERQKALCFKAFLNNHWFGLVVFIGVIVGYV